MIRIQYDQTYHHAKAWDVPYRFVGFNRAWRCAYVGPLVIRW